MSVSEELEGLDAVELAETAARLAEKYGEAIIKIGAALNHPTASDSGKIARAKLVIATLDSDEASGSDTCPICDGIGAQSGAHTERVEPCPTCGGTGRKKVEVAG